MKKWVISILAVFLLFACNLPFSIVANTSTASTTEATATVFTTASTETTVPTAAITSTSQPVTPTVQSNGIEKNLNGVSMVIPPCLANDATSEIIPESNLGSDAPDFANMPEYRKITLASYPLTDKFWDPIVQVFPVAGYTELVPTVSDTVTELQQTLNTQPSNFQKEIPLLPIEDAAQIFQAQISYLNFQNGQGIGFLTEYAQYYAPVDNTDLFYAFQGLTKDGKYWVSVFLPVNAAYLQPAYDSTTVPAGGIAAPDQNSTNLESDFQTYYANMVQKLNSTSADQFTPSLSCIAQFVQSFNIGD